MKVGELFSGLFSRRRGILSPLHPESSLAQLDMPLSVIQWSPMMRVQKAVDHYLISIVMPRVEINREWVCWDKGRLRLSFPDGSWPRRPGFLSWIKLPDDVLEELPTFDYKNGRLEIMLPRR